MTKQVGNFWKKIFPQSNGPPPESTHPRAAGTSPTHSTSGASPKPTNDFIDISPAEITIEGSNGGRESYSQVSFPNIERHVERKEKEVKKYERGSAKWFGIGFLASFLIVVYVYLVFPGFSSGPDKPLEKLLIYIAWRISFLLPASLLAGICFSQSKKLSKKRDKAQEEISELENNYTLLSEHIKTSEKTNGKEPVLDFIDIVQNHSPQTTIDPRAPRSQQHLESLIKDYVAKIFNILKWG